MEKDSIAVGIINRNKSLLNKETKLLLYYSLVYPYLQYCNVVWGNASPTNLKPLLTKQKRAVRVINNAGFIDPTNNLPKSIKILKLQDIFNLESVKFVFEQKSIPNPIITFTHSNEFHNYHTRGNLLLRPPLPTIDLDKRFVKYSGCLSYNSLPNNIKSIGNKNTFKINAKKYLINKY